MINIIEIGKNIMKLRKEGGYTQEILAEKLGISAPAVSKWENGHALPDTELLIELSYIFDCTIDHILLTDKDNISKSENIDDEDQLEQITHMLLQRLKNESNIGLDNGSIINAFIKKHGNVGNIIIQHKGCTRSENHIYQSIRLKVHNKYYQLFEKILFGDITELYRYELFEEIGLPIPRVYKVDMEKKLILMEDIADEYISGQIYDEPGKEGDYYRQNYETMLQTIARFHTELWENEKAFGRVGLPWHLDSINNFMVHLNGIENDLNRFCELLPGHLNSEEEKYYRDAVNYLHNNARYIVEDRMMTGKHIGVIHGDLHPGHVNLHGDDMSKVILLDLEAVRMGFPAEDLAMFLALHIESEKNKVDAYLKTYYDEFAKVIKDYSYKEFINDYKLAISLTMFHPIHLFVRCGIEDKNMIKKAVIAYKGFSDIH